MKKLNGIHEGSKRFTSIIEIYVNISFKIWISKQIISYCKTQNRVHKESKNIYITFVVEIYIFRTIAERLNRMSF